MSENKGGVSEKLAKKVSSLNPKDQIRFMEKLAKSVAEMDPSLVKEILVILGRAMYPNKTDSDLEALMEYRHLMYLARKVKDRVRKRKTQTCLRQTGLTKAQALQRNSYQCCFVGELF